MNGVNGAEPMWREARASDGRTYYWNTQTKETRWSAPEDAQIAPSQTPVRSQAPPSNQVWKEYATPEGRKYYYNSQTNETTWEIPDALKNGNLQSSGTPSRSSEPGFVAGGGSNFSQPQQYRDRDDRRMGDSRLPERNSNFGHSDTPRQSFVLAASTNDPEFASAAEAEAAFMKVLKRNGVQQGWSWQEAMKAAIRDPQYRAIKEPKDRRAAFDKFQMEARAQDKEREKERVEKLREDFGKMLRSHPEIKYYTRWKTARPIIEGETIFRSTSDETERRQLFEEHIIGLKKAHVESESSNRKAALEEMTTILQELNLSPYTRWPEAKQGIESNETFTNDDKFRSLTKSDVLTAFESHIKSLERSLNDRRQNEKQEKIRKERQNRDAFVDLLNEHREKGNIKAGEKWMNFRPLIENDSRYTAMLGQDGSDPMSLFWDMIDEEDQALRPKRNLVLDILDEQAYEIDLDTSIEAFMAVVRKDKRANDLTDIDLTLVLQRLHEKMLAQKAKQKEAEKEKDERRQKRAIDDLRSCMRHLDPPIGLSDTWEDVRPRLEKYKEFERLETEELRQVAFEKFMKRLQEKEADLEVSERSRRDHDREREHRRSRRHGRRSRSPEPDAYEADRRKAQADRERQYRKTALTPPVESRRRDKDDRYEGRSSGRLNGYDRDRRDREVDRERSHLSRADPRESGARELDYGESGRAGSSIDAGVSRKRRDSEDDEGSRRDSKRPRRDRKSRTRTPVDGENKKEEEKEEEVLRSGSEEGEIEEA